MGRAHICVVTAGHLATCPRMVKAADALAGAGYDVTVVSTVGWAEWAAREDEKLYAGRKSQWRWLKVDWTRQSGKWTWFVSGVRRRVAKKLIQMFGTKRLSLRVLGADHTRMTNELANVASQVSCDLYYGGGSSLAATAIAADRRGVRFGLDLEDFHSAEVMAADSGETISEIERRVLPAARFITAGSEPIAECYQAKYGVRVVPLNNTFPLSLQGPEPVALPESPLKLYWFSQTVGPERGLEDIVKAAALADIAIELNLRGQAQVGYLDLLRRSAEKEAKKLTIVHHPPAAPDEMVALAAAYDVGLCLERTTPRNRDLCLTNKAFTYLLAGLALVMTNTTGQRMLGQAVGEAAFLYVPDEIEALAAKLCSWANDSGSLLRAKRSAWQAAHNRWHWEHAEERGRFLSLVEAGLQ